MFNEIRSLLHNTSGAGSEYFFGLPAEALLPTEYRRRVVPAGFSDISRIVHFGKDRVMRNIAAYQWLSLLQASRAWVHVSPYFEERITYRDLGQLSRTLAPSSLQPTVSGDTQGVVLRRKLPLLTDTGISSFRVDVTVDTAVSLTVSTQGYGVDSTRAESVSGSPSTPVSVLGGRLEVITPTTPGNAFRVVGYLMPAVPMQTRAKGLLSLSSSLSQFIENSAVPAGARPALLEYASSSLTVDAIAATVFVYLFHLKAARVQEDETDA